MGLAEITLFDLSFLAISLLRLRSLLVVDAVLPIVAGRELIPGTRQLGGAGMRVLYIAGNPGLLATEPR